MSKVLRLYYRYGWEEIKADRTTGQNPRVVPFRFSKHQIIAGKCLSRKLPVSKAEQKMLIQAMIRRLEKQLKDLK